MFTIPTLQIIDLSANTYAFTGCKGVYGSFPSVLSKASLSLETIQLQKNATIGALPALSTLVNLVHFDVHYNKMNGTLAEGMPASLQYFSAANNLIVGSIPQSWSNLINLGTLGLAYNQLNGGIKVIADMQNLAVLYLRNNHFRLVCVSFSRVSIVLAPPI